MEERKSYTVTLLLSFFLGGLGIHRFYTGHIGIGIAQLLTCGGCGIWALIDFIMICFNNYKDAQGQELGDYNPTLGKVFFGIWVACVILSIFCYATMFAEVMKGI